MATPILPPPPSSLSNRPRSKVPPRLSTPRGSPARGGALSPGGSNNENMAPNFDEAGEGSWEAFGGEGGGGGGRPASPAFVSTTDGGDAIFSGDEGGGGLPAATAAAFGLSSPPRGSGAQSGAFSTDETNNPFASPTNGSSARPPPAPPLTSQEESEAIEVMRALSPPSPRREVRQDFETMPGSDGTSDWGTSPGAASGGGWMREPIESGVTGIPPVQPPLSDVGSDGETGARLAGGPGGGGTRGGGGRGGRRTSRPPIGASARPPRPGGPNPAGVGAVAAAASSPTVALPPPPVTMSPERRRRGRIGRRGRSASPAARTVLRGSGSQSGDGNTSDASAGTTRSSSTAPNSQPTPRRRSRSRSSTGGSGGRRGRSRSQSRSSGGADERRGRSKSRGRSSSRAPGDAAAGGASGARTRTSSRSARSRSRTRSSAADPNAPPPTTPGGSARRGRSSSRPRSSSSSVSGSNGRGRSHSRSRNERRLPSADTGTSSSRRARSRSASRPRGGPPLSASAGMARSRSRSIGGGMTMNYSSDGELGNHRPPLLQRRGHTTGNGSSASSVTSDTTGATSRISNRMRPGGNADSSSSCPADTSSAAGAGGPSNPGGHHGGNSHSSSSVIKRTNSFTHLRERLFGDSVSPEARRSYLPPRTPGGGRVDAASGGNNPSSSSSSVGGAGAQGALNTSQQPEAVYTRTLLTASVYHNQATDLWITTINTNQDPKKTNKSNASRYLKAFSFNTEREARESAYANAPPKMIPFSDSPHCFICRGKFALFRRACHCRNCGVCVCHNCSCSWPSKMIPETYNMKNSKNVKVCKSCNFLAGAFRRALTEGQYEEAVALYNTGNINLRCPFANVKGGGEVLFPIHCAAAGGNLDLLRWLVDVHHCPIKLVRTGNKHNKERGVDEPILTSKGRTVLGLAMSSQRVDVLRYLVSEKGMSVHEVKELKTSLLALEAVLNAFPRDYDDLPAGSDPALRIDIESTIGGVYRSDAGGDTTDGGASDYGSTDEGDNNTSEEDNNASGFDGSDEHDDEDDSVSTTVADACILCYENSIDCVITPCGHQICCLECSENLTACPVCNSEGQFIRIFKP